jgi:hypothetical protein
MNLELHHIKIEFIYWNFRVPSFEIFHHQNIYLCRLISFCVVMQPNMLSQAQHTQQLMALQVKLQLRQSDSLNRSGPSTNPYVRALPNPTAVQPTMSINTRPIQHRRGPFFTENTQTFTSNFKNFDYLSVCTRIYL